ncbi:MAG: hypothetical protein JO006_01710 [Paucibacter sp.]|nr:hypothetical protein [Roseateles sp.]
MESEIEIEIEIGKQPAAWLPVLMSLAAIGMVAMQLAFYGAAREADEGAFAHLWQLLMVAQLPLIAAFAYRWLRQAPRQALTILAAQALALAAAVLPVFLLGW